MYLPIRRSRVDDNDRMIKLSPASPGTTKVTFVVSADEPPGRVSVVGDFNGWDPFANPLKRRSNGTRSSSVVVASDARYEYKYLDEDGAWWCDEGGPQTANDHGGTNSVLHT